MTWRRGVGVLAMVFGLATVVEGGRTLLGGLAPDQVGFVVAFNFAAGFAYLVAGAAVLAGRAWAITLARVIAAATLIVFVALGVHIVAGGAFQNRTLAAMTLRSLFWVALSFALPLLLPGRRAP